MSDYTKHPKKQWPEVHDPMVCGIIGRDCDECEAAKQRELEELEAQRQRELKKDRLERAIGMSAESLLEQMAPGIAEIANAVFDHRKGA